MKEKILVHNGIITENEVHKKPSILTCHRCNLVNAIGNKYCSKYSYTLTPSSFEEIKAVENQRMQAVEEKYEEMNSTLQNILVAIGNVNQAGKNEIAKQLIEKGSILRQISIDLRHVFFPFL